MLELNLLITNTEGALVRVLGTIERRGFRLQGLSTQPHAQGTRVRIQLPSEGRAADVLLRQVQRLIDVREAVLDVARPQFALPPSANEPITPAAVASKQRRGMSFLGIPERVSTPQASYA